MAGRVRIGALTSALAAAMLAFAPSASDSRTGIDVRKKKQKG
jgi:hypothetical protein